MNKQEFEQVFADKVIAQLEQGIAPWRKPWAGGGYLPTNFATNHVFTGSNTFWLSMVSWDYALPLFATFKQVQALGGSVLKGSKGYPIAIYTPGKDTIDADTKKVISGRPFFTTKVVFNIEQTTCEVPAKYQFKVEGGLVNVPAECDALIAGYVNRPEIYNIEQGRAYYSPSADSITLPALKQFKSVEDYAYTLCHEMTHSTGHESRLNRFTEKAPFGCANYAQEELVADLGAQMILSQAGIQVDLENSASYIKGWLKSLNDDRSMVYAAATKASKAAERVLGKIKVLEEVSA